MSFVLFLLSSFFSFFFCITPFIHSYWFHLQLLPFSLSGLPSFLSPHFIFQPLLLQLYLVVLFIYDLNVSSFNYIILFSNLSVVSARLAFLISVFNSLKTVSLCVFQVVTPPLPLLAVPLQFPTAMIPWKGATIQVCFHCKHTVHLNNRHTNNTLQSCLPRPCFFSLIESSHEH